MPESSARWPRVSVVMPVRNEARYLARNLEAVLAQDYPADRLEVLVADGRSDDATRDVVRDVIARTTRRAAAGGETGADGASPVVLVDNPERVMPAGANAAIRRASGELILLLGGHASLPPHYVRACVECLIATGADGVGGSIDSVGEGWIGETIAAAMSSRFGIGNSGFRTAGSGEPRAADTLPFPLFKRSVYERIGLYNPRMVRHQDYEFNFRLREAGGRMLLLPALRATYHVRPSLTGLWRQYWQYGIWKGRFVRRHPHSLKVRHLAPALFALALPFAGVAALAWPPARWAFAFLLGAYLGFVLLGLASFALRGRWRVLPLLPVVMVCLHFGYGLGIWVGLAQPPVPDAPRLGDAPAG